MGAVSTVFDDIRSDEVFGGFCETCCRREQKQAAPTLLTGKASTVAIDSPDDRTSSVSADATSAPSMEKTHSAAATRAEALSAAEVSSGSVAIKIAEGRGLSGCTTTSPKATVSPEIEAGGEPCSTEAFLEEKPSSTSTSSSAEAAAASSQLAGTAPTPMPAPAATPAPKKQEAATFVGHELQWVTPEVGAWSDLGGREHQEDLALITSGLQPGVDLVCVFDGHGGTAAVTAVAEQLPDLVHAHSPWNLELGETGGGMASLERSLNLIFNQLDLKLKEKLCSAPPGPGEKRCTSGCVGLVAIVQRPHILFASIGDCRGIVVSSDTNPEAVFPADEHHPGHPDERARFEAFGVPVEEGDGGVWRAHGLEVSRAFGDFLWDDVEGWRKPAGLIVQPSVQLKVLQEKEDFALLLCSDGISNLYTKGIAASVRRALKANKPAKEISQQVIEEAGHFREDNQCVVSYVFHRPQPDPKPTFRRLALKPRSKPADPEATAAAATATASTTADTTVASIASAASASASASATTANPSESSAAPATAIPEAQEIVAAAAAAAATTD